ncbi:hypothetical protein [Nocardia sp. XZ_19_369]|uniref:hypothetical protein n=1 Tax=Nocardia sp. XZ_19_369 TaxID=2769487 RepID=UPI00188DC6CC|nr:hypothetical protein [Nocardia sp. XZ_19_369]
MSERKRGRVVRTLLRRTIGVGCLLVLTCGLVIGNANAAAADPGACFIDRGVTDAIARCHEGYGSSVLQVECVGISAASSPDGPIFGPYSGTDSVPSAVGQPMRASCMTSSALGITTRAFVSDT